MKFAPTRRQFLQTGSTAFALATFPEFASAVSRSPKRIVRPAVVAARQPILAESTFRALASAALERARAAGAQYADVRVRNAYQEVVRGWDIRFLESDSKLPWQPSLLAGIGVRALVNGCWGFAGLQGIATVDAAARLGQRAATQATLAAKAAPQMVSLAPMTPVANGQWTMPVEIDPFTITYEEITDFMSMVVDAVARQGYNIGCYAMLGFQKDERWFASTDGSSTAQTLYFTNGQLEVSVYPDSATARNGRMSADFLSGAGAGWEYIRHAPFRDQMGVLLKHARCQQHPKPIDVGRYDIVLDAAATAAVFNQTLAAATDLERAMGYRANTVGTSYFNDPLTMLDTYVTGSPLLHVTTNRSTPGSAATVKWDDEGVVPSESTLIDRGILTDFQTTRESAPWLASYYQKRGIPIQSNGCSGSFGIAFPPGPCCPNIALTPGQQDLSFDDLVKDTKKGVAVIGGEVSVDHQALNGIGVGKVMYEIVDGKIGSSISDVNYAFRTPEFWKGLVALGGRQSVQDFAKFQPRENDGVSVHTVSTVPTKFRGVAIERP